jgi:hypothetical protein
MTMWPGNRACTLLFAIVLVSEFAAATTANARADETIDAPVSFQLSGVSGAAVLADGRTLVVSLASKTALVYFDTTTGKEVKRVPLEFIPSCLAVQGDKLIAAARASSLVHVLEAASAKELRTIRVPGDPIRSLCCRPTKGYVYAATAADDIVAISIRSGRTIKTEAKGQILAIDRDGNHLYAGILRPGQDAVVVQRVGPDRFRVSSSRTNSSGGLMQYRVDEEQLHLVEANEKGPRFGRDIAVSPDGKMVAVAGGGFIAADGMREPGLPILDTGDMKTVLGTVETGQSATGVAFHPTLDMGVAANGGDLIVFSTKSFGKKDSFKTRQAGPAVFLAFGGKGRTIIYCPLTHGSHGDSDSVLEIFPLELTDKEKQTLDQ